MQRRRKAAKRRRSTRDEDSEDLEDFIAIASSDDEEDSEVPHLFSAAEKKPNTEYYDFLGVQPTATLDEIRKAYQKKARQVHPDKNPDNVEEATQQFKKLAHIYSVLSDPEKRKFYDEFGEASGDVIEGFEAAKAIYEHVMEYINSIHRVTKDDLSSFFAEIENLRKSGEVSATEDAELRSFYTKFKGDVKKILAYCDMHTPGFEKKLDTARFKKHLEKIAAESGQLATVDHSQHPPTAAAPKPKAGKSEAKTSPPKDKQRRAKK